MSWDYLIAGFLADIIVNRKERKAEKRQSGYSNISSKNAFAEKIFVNSKKKEILATYAPISLEWFDEPDTYHFPCPLFLMNDEQRAVIRNYYTRLSVNPNLIECRTALVHYLLNFWRDKAILSTMVIDMLQNELLYIIDFLYPSTQEEQMYRHLAMFLSSECYFFKGDFTNALKRLYQALDWQELLDNAEDKGGIDFNGLQKFHESIIANIINIYALMGMPEKADEVRKACSLVISSAVSLHRDILVQYRNDETMRTFLNDSINVLYARDNLYGYYLFDPFWYKENFFREACTSIIRGQAIYSIETTIMQSKEIYYDDAAQCIFDGIFGTYPSMCFKGYGKVANYKAAIEHCRKEVEAI